MKFNATIFVEGPSDQKFIQAFVRERFQYNLLEGQEIQEVEGKDSLAKYATNFAQSSISGSNLLIFDADGSFSKRQKELINKKQELGIDFELFLLPNNKDNGDLEVLLENIVTEGNKGIIKCANAFIDCLKNLSNELNLPDQKKKIYLYTDLLFKKAKNTEINYLDTDLWDLKSSYLDPLFNFLKPYFRE